MSAKNTRAKLTEAQHIARKTRSLALTEALKILIAEHNAKIVDVAREHGRYTALYI